MFRILRTALPGCLIFSIPDSIVAGKAINPAQVIIVPQGKPDPGITGFTKMADPVTRRKEHIISTKRVMKKMILLFIRLQPIICSAKIESSYFI